MAMFHSFQNGSGLAPHPLMQVKAEHLGELVRGEAGQSLWVDIRSGDRP